MHNLTTLKNGLTLITVNMPHLDSLTTLVAVGAGSRYETKKINGISHFLEHMFFKGSRKYPTAEQIATLIDGIGAVNNAATDKEVTYYWIKSSAKHIKLSCDILSSMIRESLLAEEEIEREKGVIIEELRMYRDIPGRYVWELYEKLQFGNQPLGWEIGGQEKIITKFVRENFMEYMKSLYSPKNMVLVFVGKLPGDVEKVAKSYFLDLPTNSQYKFKPFKKNKTAKPRINIFYKKTDQANIVLGVEGYDRDDKRKYASRVLSTILGAGMSSRLFIQVRERRGLAYHVSANSGSYKDTGAFTAYAGLKLEKVYEGLEVIKAELERTAMEAITVSELKKANEMERGNIALRSESTNFLAEYFGTNFILDGKIETFEEYLENIDIVTVEDVKAVAKELFKKENYNLQIIGPFRDEGKFMEILQ
ncbi:MAG: Processing protease [Microgenomates group bacterium Gr01-1014_7]|nr:MAG: Processing protease [Microgenomates group bacterium Gr01-1014_7]